MSDYEKEAVAQLAESFKGLIEDFKAQGAREERSRLLKALVVAEAYGWSIGMAIDLIEQQEEK